ncbi:hypothetical protein BCR39DRAFT_507553 [Naematelia encephala]|uniref:Uncharacterized protein n=1 Tax=Naematelia encephala TaxID=71784 RepID=A0A1Y2ANR2_9TREE|nr:hypothetical protein BCR39DRAFT_507553 [Naematelia encephala]
MAIEPPHQPSTAQSAASNTSSPPDTSTNGTAGSNGSAARLNPRPPVLFRHTLPIQNPPSTDTATGNGGNGSRSSGTPLSWIGPDRQRSLSVGATTLSTDALYLVPRRSAVGGSSGLRFPVGSSEDIPQRDNETPESHQSNVPRTDSPTVSSPEPSRTVSTREPNESNVSEVPQKLDLDWVMAELRPRVPFQVASPSLQKDMARTVCPGCVSGEHNTGMPSTTRTDHGTSGHRDFTAGHGLHSPQATEDNTSTNTRHGPTVEPESTIYTTSPASSTGQGITGGYGPASEANVRPPRHVDDDDDDDDDDDNTSRIESPDGNGENQLISGEIDPSCLSSLPVSY